LPEKFELDTPNELNELCATIRSNAEKTHCPSEVIGVEQWMEKSRRDLFQERSSSSKVSRKYADLVMSDSETPPEGIAAQMAKDYEALKNDDIAFLKKITNEIVGGPTRKMRFEIVTASINEENVQVLRRNESEWFVVLPQATQDILNFESDDVTEEMVKAKDQLREWTMHELSHVIIREHNKIKFNFEPTTDEEHKKEHRQAKKLAETMISAKMRRNEMIRAAQSKYPSSHLNKYAKS
jgi:rubrerythrin